ncbi:unnamed protein product [Darwinula stevensoni]|uniref:Beta-glucosidase n=1 Tax=Darwinula stevensoni TaxID=69355 RepID=A0A7R8XDI9_9CRUS|nr:unnamed protein product [Darwinula stevensoni]CAG0888728.1 unnamed protein product [Darwinula stevensoni]
MRTIMPRKFRGRLCPVWYCVLFFIVWIFFSWVFFYTGEGATGDDNLESWFVDKEFPEGFHWGVATAAYQIEGAWNKDGKKESIWDEFAHRRPSPIKDGSTGDDACMSYDFYKSDVKILQQLGVRVYRFSISWSRVLPDGTTNSVNEQGVLYYRNLIEQLLSNGIEPMVTLYHWDLPLALQKKGGWLSKDSAKWFEDYSRFCFDTFGPKVKLWVTLNEPWVVSVIGFEKGDHAPGVKDPGVSPYIVAHHLLLAHAKAYRIYQQHYRKLQKGLVGIALNTDNFKAASGSKRDVVDRAFQFHLGWFAHPIFSKEGNYPGIMMDRIAMNSAMQGYNYSRLPSFNLDEIQFIKGSADFLGLNSYGTTLVSDDPDTVKRGPSYTNDSKVIKQANPYWETTPMGWQFYPDALKEILAWIRDEYNNPPVYVTETGFPDDKTMLEDRARINFLEESIRNVWEAIQYGSAVRGFIVWSLMDNFEWAMGYSVRFGLYEVDFNDPKRTRTPRMSAYFYQNVTQKNALSGV